MLNDFLLLTKAAKDLWIICASIQLQLIYLNVLMTGLLVFLVAIILTSFILSFSKTFDNIVFFQSC